MPQSLNIDAPTLNRELGISEIKSWGFERREFEIIPGNPRPLPQVRAFRACVDGIMYDFQITARGFLRDYLDEDRNWQFAYTVAVFGHAAEMTPSAGRIYRFTAEHLFAPNIAEKMGVTERTADAIVQIMRSFDHSGVTCREIDANTQQSEGENASI